MESEILREVEEIERRYQQQDVSAVGRTNIDDTQIMDHDAYNQPTMSHMVHGQISDRRAAPEEIHIEMPS